MSTTIVVDATYELIERGRLHESPLNPRRTYDPAKLQELRASIAAKGVISPLLVRPNAKGFEIAAGHRRFRAAALADVSPLPCIIRPVDDAEFVEILNIENLQREYLMPLEEAEGYKLLMTKAAYSVERIAERVGKSEKYGELPQRAHLFRRQTATLHSLNESPFHDGPDVHAAEAGPHRQQEAMLVNVVQAVDPPENVVATAVGLQGVDGRHRRRPHQLCFFGLDVVVLTGRIGDRKVYAFERPRLTRADKDKLDARWSRALLVLWMTSPVIVASTTGVSLTPVT